MAATRSTAKKTAAKKTATKKTAASNAPAKRRTGRPTKYNYELARQYFVEGMPVDDAEPDGDRDWPNLRVLSDRTKIPYERIRQHAASERWTMQKHNHQAQVAQDRQQKRMAQMGKESIEFDTRSLDISKMGLQLIGVRMGEIAQMVKVHKDAREDALQRLQAGEPVARQELWSQIRADEMERLAKAAAVLQDIGRKALGTDVTQVQVQGDVSVQHAINVAAELERDDPDRLAAFMAAAERAHIWEQLELAGPPKDTFTDPDDDDGVVEAELVE
jgi:hypothetical protein